MTLHLASRLALVASVTDVENLRRLEEIIKSIEPTVMDADDREALFRVFERFPDDDAFGGFFAILHKLEASKGYDVSSPSEATA